MPQLTERQKELLRELEKTSPANYGITPGKICEASGVYRAGKDQYIPLSKGERFPPCKGCESQFWFLVIPL